MKAPTQRQRTRISNTTVLLPSLSRLTTTAAVALSMAIIIIMITTTTTTVIIGVDAAILDTTISSGFTQSVDDIVNQSNTILNVNSMILDASLSGNATALFNATRLYFKGGILFINCSGVNVWEGGGGMSSSPSLEVHIIDGISIQSNVPILLIGITGSLSRGSKIIIRGGTFALSYVFFRILYGGLLLKDGSQISITKVSFIITPNPTVNPTILLNVLGTLSLADANTALLFNDNNISIASGIGTVTASWKFQLKFSFQNSAVNVTNSSILSISGNSINFKEIRMLSSKSTLWYLWDSYSSSPITVTQNGSILIYKNNWIVENLISGGTWQWRVLNVASGSDITLSDSSSLRIDRNIFKSTIVQHTSAKFYLLAADTSATVTIEDNSSLTIDSNEIVYHQHEAETTWQLNLASLFSTTTLTNISNFTLNNNTVTVSEISISSVVLSWDWKFMDHASGGVVIALNSHLSISDNNVNVAGVAFSEWMWSMFSITDCTLVMFSMSTVRVDRNVISIANTTATNDVTWQLIHFSGTTAALQLQTDSCTFSVTDNNVTVTALNAVDVSSGPTLLWAVTTLNTILTTSPYTIDIRGNTFNINQINFGTFKFYVSFLNKGVVVNFGGIVRILENNVYISNLQTSGQFVYGVLYSEGGVGVISGGIDVSHNHLYVVNSIVGTAWTVGVAGVIDSITQNMVTSGSAASLNITSNIVSGTNTTCNTMIWIMCNNIQNVLQNSVTTISENKMEAELVSVAFSKIWYVIRAMRGLVVNSNGTLYLTNNILTSTNTTSKNKDVCVVVYVTALQFVVGDQGSTIIIIRNTIIILLLQRMSLPIVKQAIPTATLIDAQLGTTGTIINGQLIITSNSLEVEGGNTTLSAVLLNNKGETISTTTSNGSNSSGGFIEASNNNIVYGGTIFSIDEPPLAFPSATFFRTCRNYVNGGRCGMIGGGSSGGGGSSTYGCMNVSTVVMECSTTNTPAPPTPSLTTPTTPTNTATSHSVPLTLPSLSLSSNTSTKTPTTNATLSIPTTQRSPSRTTKSHNMTTTSSERDNINMTSLSQSTPPPQHGNIMNNTTSRTLDVVPTATSSQLPICPTTSSPVCPFTTAVKIGNASITFLTTSSSNNYINHGCGVGGKGISISIPFETWSSGGEVYVAVPLYNPLSTYYSNYLLPPNTTTSGTAGGGVLKFSTEPLMNISGGVWGVSRIQYIGEVSMSAWTASITIMTLTNGMFRCTFERSSGGGGGEGDEDNVVVVRAVPLHILLEAAPPITDALSTAVEVAVVVSVLTVSPGGLVRAGMMNALIDMLRCSVFDPNDDISFISNPLRWGVGREVLQYYRGSVATVLIVMCVLSVCAGCGLTGFKVCTGSSTWAAAVDKLRLPSMPLVAVLLVGEVCVSSATSLLLYEESDASDIVLAIAALFPILVYLGLYLRRTLSSEFIVVIPAVGGDNRGKTALHRTLRFALEATHEVEVKRTKTDENEDHDDDERRKVIFEGERWLRRNFYFVAERRWAAYGAIEAIGGTIVNILEGLPITTTSRTLCIARPASVTIITAMMLILLLWRVPCAVRVQQFCAVLVAGGMMLTGALATANAVRPASSLELAAAYIGTVAVCASMVLGIVEMCVMLMTYVPSIRRVLDLRSRTLQTVIDRSRKIRNALHIPMLAVAVVTTSQAAATAATAQQPPIIINNKNRGQQVQRTPPPSPPLQPLQPPVVDEDDDLDEDAEIARVLDQLEAWEKARREEEAQ